MRNRMRIMIAALLVVFAVDSSNAADTNGDKEPVALNVVFGLDPGKGKYDGVVGKPNDTWNFLDVGQTSIKALRSHAGSATPVNLQVSENDGEWGIEDHTGVFHAYIYHNSRDVDLQAKFTGLARGQYRIYVYAHGDAQTRTRKSNSKSEQKNTGARLR